MEVLAIWFRKVVSTIFEVMSGTSGGTRKKGKGGKWERGGDCPLSRTCGNAFGFILRSYDRQKRVLRGR